MSRGIHASRATRSRRLATGRPQLEADSSGGGAARASHPAGLRLPGRVLDEVVAHARAEAPRECCGLLIGRAGEIERAFPARNARRGTTRYLIDPRDHFAAIKAAREAGAGVVGYYHSHPSTAPQPSPTAAYWLLDGNFRAVPLVRVG
jgi:hypothetical protein